MPPLHALSDGSVPAIQVSDTSLSTTVEGGPYGSWSEAIDRKRDSDAGHRAYQQYASHLVALRTIQEV